jgi:magnesium chelatase family protein
MRIFSFSPFGYEGSLVAVEVDLRRGIPAVDIVGLADGAVRESRERMRSAIRNSGFDFPQERVLISLSPADMRKEGAGFDLALALAVLDAKQRLDGTDSDPDCAVVLVMGELELSGAIRPVKGIHAAVSTAAAAGISRCVVSEANGDEAREVSGVHVCTARTLSDAYALLFERGHKDIPVAPPVPAAFVPAGCIVAGGTLFAAENQEMNFSTITGQPALVRGLQIAAAGGHNVLVYGPPGCGKSLALRFFPELLPLLTVEEALPVTRIHSLAGNLSPSEPLLRIPPFRMPHQTATIEGMCGGGVNCRPGEISLAHNGALFLDEVSEFRSSVLQMLRVPLESGCITLSRAGRSTTYPARFQLLMAANPCPCGNYGTPGRLCLCSARSIELYWKKISGPLLDRIDIRIPVGAPVAASEAATAGTMTTAQLRQVIGIAVNRERLRQGKKNAELTPPEVHRYCCLEPDARQKLDTASLQAGFSPRAVASCLKIARTIADMDNSEVIQPGHLSEAVHLRCSEGALGMFGVV